MATKACPFCGNPAQSKTVADAYNLDCGYCDIRIEISKAAFATPCTNHSLLRDIQGRITPGVNRLRIDRAAMTISKQEALGD